MGMGTVSLADDLQPHRQTLEDLVPRTRRDSALQPFPNSSWSPFDSATPASTLISTGKTAPFSNMSCMRTFPSISEGVAATANTSSAAAGAPGGCSVLSNSAMATAGASSVAMATFVADRLELLRARVPVRLEAGFVIRTDVGERATWDDFVMVS